MKKMMLTLMVFLSIVLLTGCQNQSAIDVTTLQINKDGTVSITLVEDFEKPYYDISELEAVVTAEADDYNKETGKQSVTVEKVSSKETTAIVKMTYDTAKDYEVFNRTVFFAGTLAEAENKGYMFREPLASVAKDGGTITASQAKEAGYFVLVVQEKMNIKVPGKVLYTSNTVSTVSAKEVSVTDDESISYIIYE